LVDIALLLDFHIVLLLLRANMSKSLAQQHLSTAVLARIQPKSLHLPVQAASPVPTPLYLAKLIAHSAMQVDIQQQ